jgi:hypothetical protein
VISSRCLALSLTCCLGPLVLAAQEQDPRLARVDSTARAAVAALVDSARSAGLPTSPLVEKALEGTTKGASGVAIVGAVRALAGALAVARDALGLQALPEELGAGAVALRAGARPDDLTRLRAARAPRSLVVPLGVLTDLVARGVPLDTAARVVLALAKRAGDADYIAFRRDVEHDIALGIPPAVSASGQLNASARAALADPARKP